MSTQHVLTESNVGRYLHGLGLLGPDEPVQVEKPGEGNINWVRRVRRSGEREPVVVKQARPALERFPEYEVTTERIAFEARYYRTVAPFDHEGICPRVILFDEAERVLVLEDLGDPPALDAAIAAGHDVEPAMGALARFLGRVHAGTGHAAIARDFENEDMKRLHGDHVFALPLRPNEFPLDAALRERADALMQDTALVALADGLYEHYLGARRALVHGDVQAGNLLLAPKGPRLLDAEIAHCGDPAFDVGVLLAHLLLPKGDPFRARAAASTLWREYGAAHGAGAPAFEPVARYAGIEMLRRTIGAARVASVHDPAAAGATLDDALALLREPPAGPESL